MKISLVVTNSRRKSLVFVSDSFKTLSLEETLTKATSASFDNLFVVKGSYGEYLVGVAQVKLETANGLIKGWSKYIDISGMPEILGTLYHRSYVSPHAHPKPNKRGSQISEEFYALATRWLKS
ncbi:MAG: hypothetical protein NUV98_02455 [Candidatus Roizmanbacteria bacterium]|nr:hypothetical protein [Candidatus Roizmanbacteria bacterium]